VFSIRDDQVAEILPITSTAGRSSPDLVHISGTPARRRSIWNQAQFFSAGLGVSRSAAAHSNWRSPSRCKAFLLRCSGRVAYVDTRILPGCSREGRAIRLHQDGETIARIAAVRGPEIPRTQVWIWPNGLIQEKALSGRRLCLDDRGEPLRTAEPPARVAYDYGIKLKASCGFLRHGCRIYGVAAQTRQIRPCDEY